ncbi:MAG: YCF48-related protein [Chlorobi bacterium]|nr:YCF48-related protein [Chlorobiota bacterium]MCI0715288.1 YCF48-related protein [Chlorobiota bacterium]
MKKIIYTLLTISLFHQFAVSQWLQQVSGVTTSLLDIDFINANTGWTCGDNGVILKTTNGGLNWVQQASEVLKRLEGIDAVDANTLYCVGWFQTILKSTNGGTNWLIIRDGQVSPPDPSFFKCYFLNANTGWLLRSLGGYVLRTTNGGLSFDSTFTNNSFNRDIYFKDPLNGVLCGNGAWVMKSTDGGITWNQIFLPLLTSAPNLYRLSFVGDFGWTIGEGGESGLGRMVFRTTNFGSNWDSIARVPYPNNELNYSVFFSSLNTGYAGGTAGYLFKSTNGGFNWYQQVITGGGFRRDFNFVNDTVGWVVGGGGQIFKTTTGGQFVSIVNISSEIPIKHNLQNIYPNPFNPIANIIFDVAFVDNVEIIVYDILGRKVEVLVSEKLNPGKYKIIFNGENFSSGVYICNLITSKMQISKTMVLIK